MQVQSYDLPKYVNSGVPLSCAALPDASPAIAGMTNRLGNVVIARVTASGKSLRDSVLIGYPSVIGPYQVLPLSVVGLPSIPSTVTPDPSNIVVLPSRVVTGYEGFRGVVPRAVES